MRLTLRAPAKINLHLDVGPRRPDGYHDLVTVFQTVSLHDTLTFRLDPAGGISLTMVPVETGRSTVPADKPSPAPLPVDGNNLIVRALEALRAKMKTKLGMQVQLEKRIPMGAGLGGGSSDAAAALWGGWRLWKRPGRILNVPRRVPPMLIACAKKLGADVPFFLSGGLAWATGVGEKLKALPAPPSRWAIVVYPRVHVSTPEAYRRLDDSRAGQILLWHPAPRAEAALAHPFNSFEPVICANHPAIGAAIRTLSDLGCRSAMMSGSGSAVFGFVSGRRDGERVARELATKPWDVFLVKTI